MELSSDAAFIIPDEAKAKPRGSGHVFYDWKTPEEIRFVKSWDTKESDVNEFLRMLS